MVLYQILASTIHGKISKNHTRTITLKYQLQHGMKNLNDLMDYILYQIIKIIKVIKNHEKVTDNPSIRIYVNKIKNRIIFRIKTGYFLELFMSETMKLLASIKSKITKNENDENVPHLEVIEVVLVHCNIDNNDYQQDSRVLYTIFPSKFLG